MSSNNTASSTEDEWSDRRRIVLKTARVYTSLSELIEGAKQNKLSLAVFKPTRILDLTVEEEDREWDPKKVEVMRAENSQLDLFDDKSWATTFRVIPKLPYSFSYRFEDAEDKASELQILDWEIGALYWNCLADAHGDEEKALAKVREKYMDDFFEKDLHFFLGTTQRFHLIAPNPWVIVGVFPIPHERQLRMF